MSRKRTIRLAGAVLLATGTATALATPSVANPQTAEADSPKPVASAAMAEAMQRDLGLTAEQAQTRLAQETKARNAEDTLRQSLGNSFGGAFFDAERGKLVVGTTDASEKSAVRSAGAVAKVVPNSKQELNAAKAELDRMEGSAPDSITGWYVDTRSNSVVVNVNKTKRDAETNKFLARARSVDESVRVEQVKRSPRTLYNLIGGDAYYMGSGGRCSVGFPLQGGGMVTAGHCGDTGTSASGHNQVHMGYFQGSSFPGNDYAWVSANSSWTSKPWVNMYNGYARTVAGSQEAPVGSSICRSGSTTGWHCGTVEAKNQTVRYSQGAVYGLTRTDVCAEPGDSGGSFISGNQAQGMTSGGSGNCTLGGTTFFQPVNEALNAYGLQLATN
ncbi:streptogrisin C [Halopolyspora algeriensis]|uniref:Streptogrisin C n=1 Tax=Halopolyspora algeriensis TaxID=1500506 RepID=A0A368VVG0_9ACTN|nr:S1 family peptidase [Halopolyspora algeriensis]RCW45276.1 streptogrisin C [Halopolyspora algeriensis]TQM47317.1 streptogrisin C [Halopolyspora algeriensis]